MITVEGFPGLGDVTLDGVCRLEGPNGCGKTSLLRSAAGLAAPLVPHRIEVHGSVAFVPQHPHDGLLGLTVAGEARLRGVPLPAELETWATRDVATLTPGQARRVALAIAFAQDSGIILLDEPAEHLDADGRRRLAGILSETDKTVILSDHTASLPGRPVRFHAVPPVSPPATAMHLDRLLPGGPIQNGQWRGEAPELAIGIGINVHQAPNGNGKSTALRHWSDAEGLPLLVQSAGRLLPGCPIGELAEPEALAAWQVDHLARRMPWQVSGGEAQRVALARILGRDGDLLLDEPDAHLDAEGRAYLWETLAARRDRTVVATP